jgi:predicted RNA-binding protein with PIN domain
MDQPGTDRRKIMESLRESLGEGFVEMGPDCQASMPVDMEELAMCGEKLMEEYLETGTVSTSAMQDGIAARNIFPVSFGSALKVEGVQEFLGVLEKYTRLPAWGPEFGAQIFKITRDKQGMRQTHMKITGGVLRSKMVLQGGIGVGSTVGGGVGLAPGSGDVVWEEKVEQIRLYSGSTYQMVQEAEAGTICTVTGLSKTFAGEGLGVTGNLPQPVLEPALTYQVLLPEGADPVVVLQKLRQLEEENPLLHLVWKEKLKEIHIQVMGELELEILQHIAKERFDLNLTFGQGSLIYKETIGEPIIGIGHFEPLRHYAEVHLLLEPGQPGSGLVFDTICSEDKLDRNWQRLILTHLQERQHPGVLTGSDLTDVKITLLAGRAHLKHTEGGDFRQATYRAVRQGLRKAMAENKVILLEPFYGFRLEVPSENLGRAMSDVQRYYGTCQVELAQGLNSVNAMGTSAVGNDVGLAITVLTGEGPVATFREYAREVAAYTGGRGRFLASVIGYRPCHNQNEIAETMDYRPEQDLENPTGSVFCQHGAAVYVSWDQVDDMAQVDSGYKLASELEPEEEARRGQLVSGKGSGILAGREADYGEKELEAIFLRTYGKSKREEALRRAHQSQASRRPSEAEAFPTLNWKGEGAGASYLLVDGYNVIFAWEELKDLAKVNLDGAREAFLETLSNYQGYKKMGVLVVFDGYRVPGNPGTRQRHGNVDVVFTKEAETADQFIEKTTYELAKKYKITVVTSDRLVQMSAWADGASRMSAREFYQEVVTTSEEIRNTLKRYSLSANRPFQGKL